MLRLKETIILANNKPLSIMVSKIIPQANKHNLDLQGSINQQDLALDQDQDSNLGLLVQHLHQDLVLAFNLNLIHLANKALAIPLALQHFDQQEHQLVLVFSLVLHLLSLDQLEQAHLQVLELKISPK